MNFNYDQPSNQQMFMGPQNFPLNNPVMMMPPNPNLNNFNNFNNQPSFNVPPNNANMNFGQNQMAQLFPNMQFVYVQDPMTELANCTGIEIKQQPEFFEMMTGCETANRYHVFGKSPQGYKYLFKCNEKSGWFMRNCCPSEFRQFFMDIVHITSGNPDVPGFSKNFATLFKPFMCTICCLCRPEMYVTLNEGNNRVGIIRHTCTLCDPEFNIYDGTGKLLYILHADCCQCGLICSNNFFGKLSEVIFSIYDPGRAQIIGNILKKPANFSEMVTDADSYQINFPKNATPQEKLLIIALALMIDYQYFETNSSSEDQRRRRGRGHHMRY